MAKASSIIALLAAVLSLAAPGSHARENSPEQNYILRCSGCHDMDGSGLERGGIPPLPGYLGAFVSDPAGRSYLMHVPGVIASGLNDSQLAILMNYLNQKWGNPQAKPFSEAEVRQLRAEPIDDVVKYRREIVRRFVAEGIPIGDYPWP